MLTRIFSVSLRHAVFLWCEVWMTKQQLRTTLLHQLKTQKEEERRRKSRVIHRKVRRLAAFRKAQVVCCYVSLPYEVETWRLIEQMLETGKRVVVPRVRNRTLQLSAVSDLHRDLAPGTFGVWEPTRASLRLVDPTDVDLVLVPGLAFDRQGHRLGHGQGYFDRLLARVPKTTPTVGVCFDFQLLDRLPTHPHDRPVQTVLTA